MREQDIAVQSGQQTQTFVRNNAEILEMIATGQSASDIYNAIALMYEARHQGLRCSLLELKGDKLKHGGAPSLPKEYCDAVNGLQIGPNVGSCGTSTYTGKRVLVENIETDPKWAEIKQAALPHGMRCCWSEPIKDSNGKVLGAFGMYYNHPALPNEDELSDLQSASRLASIIMERDQRGSALRQSEEKYRTLVETMPNGFYISTPEGYFLDANPAFINMLGYDSLDELKKVYIPSDIYVHEIERETAQKNTEFINKFESHRLKRKDGTIILIEDSARYIKDKDGVVLYKEGICKDVTERKHAEEALKKSHATFLTVLDSIDATIYVADLKTYKILFNNKYMIKNFGKDTVGEICWDVFRKESGQCPDCTNNKLIDENGEPTDVFVWQGQNPITKKWYINYDRAIPWTDGRLVKLQIATDISDLKKLEEELSQAHKMESIGTLAGGVAHDFNNILFPIMGHIEMLMEDVRKDSPFQESLNEIYNGALRARDLVKQILTFSRQESGDVKLIKIQPILKEAFKLMRSTIPTTIDIEKDINSNCVAIKADPTQIHQIIMNLSTNAYHAMENTGGELKVSLKEVKLEAHDIITSEITPGGYACLSVADTGIGMDQQLIGKIFDPFFTTKKDGKGSGMGLSVVHGIVKNLGGAIYVNSEVSKGTEILIYFPVAKDSSEKQKIQAKQQIQKGTEHVLLVDDEEAILTMEKMMLERLGYQLTSRTSSIEALKAFRNNPAEFDLVITDMAMPNMSGDILSAELTKIRPDIPILLCTGFSETMSEEKAESLGINGFLLKPILMKDLSHKIREVLENEEKQKLSINKQITNEN